MKKRPSLHRGDSENRALWDKFLPACIARLQEAYDRLEVTFDEQLGESAYNDALPGVVEELQSAGIATESEGAIAVFLENHKAPMLIRKKDGAFLYATTDLATIRHRINTWDPDDILYVVDHRQSLHFDQLFTTARKWGMEKVGLHHVAFGTILGDDGKPYKTRSGGTVSLDEVMDEAVAHALRVVSEKDDGKETPELGAAERENISERLGLGAIKYADLSHNRTSDYVFSYEKMMALQGNTATYMQYAYVRVQSIFRKGKVDLDTLRNTATISLGHPAERTLALALLRFEEALQEVTADYRPNVLTSYLYDQVAQAFSGFHEHCPVLTAPSADVRESRLLLCDLTGRTLQAGLELLGIQVIPRM